MEWAANLEQFVIDPLFYGNIHSDSQTTTTAKEVLHSSPEENESNHSRNTPAYVMMLTYWELFKSLHGHEICSVLDNQLQKSHGSEVAGRAQSVK